MEATSRLIRDNMHNKGSTLNLIFHSTLPTFPHVAFIHMAISIVAEKMDSGSHCLSLNSLHTQKLCDFG